ncbi:cadherin repeat domain-containing protein [Amylibacter sp.]|nr:cadherin repeat domain-containing protein [Amylibacter sp.]
MTQIDAEDPDGDTIILSLAGDDSEEFILQETGRLSFLAPPDFESRNFYDLVVTTSDTKLSSLLNLEINILNENDNPP